MFKNRKNRFAEKEYNQQLIHLARVTRVMAGGKRMRFRATVAIGDGNGRVGFAVAKGADVTLAINKAVRKAKKNLIVVPIINKTIPHEVRVKYKSGKLLLKPAPIGTGIKAGSVVRQILELGGVPNVIGKILGTRNKLINAQAVIIALSSFKTDGLKLDKTQPKKAADERFGKSFAKPARARKASDRRGKKIDDKSTDKK
ncbi:MAG: ribosomal protein S5 [Patescibacteria group bacterium]